jgi:hypothetical protein
MSRIVLAKMYFTPSSDRINGTMLHNSPALLRTIRTVSKLMNWYFNSLEFRGEILHCQ